MGGPLPEILSESFMTKAERKVVEPTKKQFYRRFTHDIINKCNKVWSVLCNLLQSLNSDHPNIKYTTERSPDKILDTEIVNNGGITTTDVNPKDRKLAKRWPSRSPHDIKRCQSQVT